MCGKERAKEETFSESEGPDPVEIFVRGGDLPVALIKLIDPILDLGRLSALLRRHTHTNASGSEAGRNKERCSRRRRG